MKSTGLIQLVGKLHRAGKIHNLHQVCGVLGCVARIINFNIYKIFTILVMEKNSNPLSVGTSKLSESQKKTRFTKVLNIIFSSTVIHTIAPNLYA